MRDIELRRVDHLSVGATSLQRPGIRNDIQGLRGIAVLLVVLYHAGVPGLSGGFVGVDVFFVISGFLITGLLVRESTTTGRIDFARFFARRARRLLPAALLVTVTTALVALWIYPPVEQREIISGARAASFYMINHWLAGRSIDYLAGDADSNPLLHMWSLAVEEQFYLVWPLIVTLGMRFAGGRWLAVLIGSLSALSLAACVAMTWRLQPWAFFLMPFRAWEFGAGALVQLTRVRGARFVPPGPPQWLGWFGALLIVASATCLDTSRLFPGLWALMPASGTAFVLWGIHRSPRGVGALISASPLRFAGDVSYSWYLWHWPALVCSHVLAPRSGPTVTIAALALSLVLATLTWRWIERPIHLGPPAWLRRSANSLGAALAASLLVGAACTAVATWVVKHDRDPLQREFADAAADIPRVYAAGCHATFDVTDLPRCTFGVPDASTKILLFGDSHAAQWFPALDRLAHEHGWQLISLTKSLCPAAQMPVYSAVLRRNYIECDEWRERMFSRIAAEHPTLIVVSSSSQNASAAEWLAAVSITARRLALSGARQLWVQDTPWPGVNGPRCLARAQWQGRIDISATCAFDRDKVMAPSLTAAEAQRNAVARWPNTRSLDLTDVVCPTRRCTTWRDGRLVYSDGNHIAASWAELQSPRFDAAMKDWPMVAPAGPTAQANRPNAG